MLMFILAFIGIAMVVRRALAIKGVIPTFNPGGGPPFDGSFARHPVITFIHILPGALFMVLGVLQFVPRIRRRYPRYHRFAGRVFVFTGYIVGLSALAMPFVMRPIGGLNEATGTILFAIYFLVALTKTWSHARKRHLLLHREWMIRTFALGLAVATIRPIIALFFAFSHQPPQVFFGTAFWLGFTLHAIAAEVWINVTRPAPRTAK
jgi:uncharacterized membrane protein